MGLKTKIMNTEQKQPILNKNTWSITSFMHWLSHKSERTIEVEIPKGFMNCDVSTCNHFTANTNDSKFWDTLKFPLPKPKYKWNIKHYTGDADNPEKQRVVLIDKY
jgi:hypothetical protein